MFFEILAKYVEHLAWPLTLVFLLLFLRKELKGLIGRVQTATLPGGTELKLAIFGESSVDKAVNKEASPPPLPIKSVGDWQKSGNVFWLGHDLMWTIDVLLRNASKIYIIRGLSQSLHHLRELGLSGTKYDSILSRLYESAEKSLETDWTSSEREKYAIELRSLLDFIGAVATAYQPGYLARPANEIKLNRKEVLMGL